MNYFSQTVMYYFLSCQKWQNYKHGAETANGSRAPRSLFKKKLEFQKNNFLQVGNTVIWRPTSVHIFKSEFIFFLGCIKNTNLAKFQVIKSSYCSDPHPPICYFCLANITNFALKFCTLVDHITVYMRLFLELLDT